MNPLLLLELLLEWLEEDDPSTEAGPEWDPAG